MKKRSSEATIGFLREAEAGRLPIKQLCRRHGFSEASYYLWRNKFGGHCQLVEGSALLPREIDVPDRFQQAHVTASHSTNARVRSRRW